MPSEDLHSRLMKPAGVRPYVAIPTLASWKGDVVRAKQRLQQFRAEDQREAIAKQFDFHSEVQRTAIAHQFQSALKVNPVGPTSAAHIKQLGFIAAVAAQHPQTRPQHVPQQPVGRVAGNLTDPYVIDAAIERYQAGTLQAGEPNDQISKAIHGSLLVDIYTVTGQFMGVISRNPKLRTDNDCALFPFYRALNWAAADAFGQVFGINGDEIDVYLKRQLIGMTTHGAMVDANVGSERFKDPTTGKETSRLVYLSDSEALALQLHIRAGKLMITNGQGELDPFDCSGDEYKDNTRGPNGEHTKTANTAYSGRESNGGKGVAGFAMGLNRNIYATKHWNHPAAKGSFYHSSYLAGREVLCTGCITVVDGTLTYINNDSGHYQPRPQQLAWALQALQALGVDITNVAVDCTWGKARLRDQRAPFFLSHAAFNKGMSFDVFDETKVRDAAKRVREAIAEYEARFNGFKGFFKAQSQTSKDAVDTLKRIRDDKTLIDEVHFLLYPSLKRWWPDLKPIVSPLGTHPSKRFRSDTVSDLRPRLETAIEPLLGPEASRKV